MSAVFVDVASVTTFTRDVLVASGADAEEAGVVAPALVWADRIGRTSHGVWRLPTLARRFREGLIRSPCEVRFELRTPAVGIVDGGQGSGHFVGHVAVERAIALARECGVGCVAVRNSNHFGAAAYFVERACEQDMMCLATSNSVPKVAAYGGRRAVLGTNPLAFGVPRRGGRSFLLDMATAASAGSTVMKLIESGAELPEGIAIDPDGRPIRDPAQVSRGALLPFGGAKGFGLSLLVEILSGVLTGGGISHQVKSMYTNFEETGNNGHFFLVLDVTSLMTADTCYERMETLVSFLKASAAGEDDVRIPGELRWEAFERSLAEGVRIDERARGALEELAGETGVSLPW